MFNVVLFEPEIPSNTGNIGRTCVVTGSRLHLIGPLGFSLGDDMLRRAGLGYWHSLDVTTYAGWEEFLAQNGLGETDERLHLLTKKARKTYAQATYADGDFLVFGKESTGLPEELLARAALSPFVAIRTDDSQYRTEAFRLMEPASRFHPQPDAGRPEARVVF